MSTPCPAPAADERQRADYLRSLGVLNDAPAPWFDSLVQNAAASCGTGFAAITLIDEHHCWLKACVGLDRMQLPRSTSYCGVSFLSSGVFELPDAWADERFRQLPLAQGPDAFRFYAAAPLVSSRGFSLGTLCVLDRLPRHLAPEQRAALAALAQETVVVLESRDRGGVVEEPPAGRAVLIVDDEELMRHFASEVVRRAGYVPIVASGGAAGFALWQEHRAEIVAVVTDMNMPGVNGLDLARRLRAHPPSPPVIVMTGNADTRVRAAVQAGEFTALVAKPFMVETLQTAVARAAALPR